MDTTDEEIVFDEHGVCNHCHTFDRVTKPLWHPNEQGARLWERRLEEIRVAGKGREYDCIIGLSGGVDSSYVALKAKDWDLRPLVVHVDAGWNSELATANIEAIVRHCGYDLHTVVMDWPVMRDLQLAYLKAGVANQDVPQDHAFFANLYKFSVDHGINYTLSGGNFATESILAASWGGPAMDAINLKAIHRAFGSSDIKSYKTIGFFDYFFVYPFIRKMRVLYPLNYMPYSKEIAISELSAVGWRPYGRKHGESRFTKLFQNYYLPTKFGYDKRKGHLSSLVVAGLMTRDDALNELRLPLYDPRELESDIEYYCKKLGITREGFEGYMSAPSRHHTDFPNWNGRMKVARLASRAIGKLTGRGVKVYG